MNDKSRKSTVSDAKAGERAGLLKRALLEIEALDAKLAAAERVRTEPIAIIGMACRFAAGANSPEAFWELLAEGRDGITEVPPSRWSVEEWYDPDPDAVGKAYTVMGGFMDDVDSFDAHFFGVSPREAEQMDPQQRWLLQVSWEALENAGLAPDRMVGSQTGVFVGMTGSDFLFLQTGNDPGNIDTYVASGNSHAVAAGRLSYVLGFRGPAMTIDTACSSALLSVHLACHSLRIGECDTALAGGVLLLLSPGAYVTACKARLLSPDGRCKTFDDSADGYVRAEGCAMVALKRLSDAQRDGDNILAVIRGSACNQDGRSGGLTVPSGNAQEAVIRQALANAGVEPNAVSYVEAHGTGTSLGDPIEVQALDNVYSQQRAADRPLVIGSVKSNIGHTEALAGVAGLIKLVLALRHGKIPGDLHFHTPNTHIPWKSLSIEVADKLTDWPEWADRRIGGLSSFGFSGTNVHMLVEQAPPMADVNREIERPSHLLALSARREDALADLAGLYVSRLQEDRDDETVADICHTANAGRSHFEYRTVIECASKAELVSGLEGIARGDQGGAPRSGKIQLHAPFNVGFVFSGEGCARVNMGRVLFDTQPAFRNVIVNCDRLLKDRLDKPLLSVLYPAADDQAKQILDDPRYAQPALFALQWALAVMWESFGVSPSVVTGHGCGEIAAACAAGILEFEQGLILAAERGLGSSECNEPGAIAAVAGSEDEVLAVISGHPGVAIAAVNSPRSIVISGAAQAVEVAVQDLAGKGMEAVHAACRQPLHTAAMKKVAMSIVETAQAFEHGSPHIDFVSMVTGRVASGPQALTASYWGEQLQSRLHVFEALRAVRAHDCRALVEIGPGNSLLAIARRALPSARIHWLPSLGPGRDDWGRTLANLADLYVAGMDVDWRGFDQGYPRRKVVLPTYPFDPHSYPIKELAPRRRYEDLGPCMHPLVGRRFHSPQLSDWIWESRLYDDVASFGHYRYFESPLAPSGAFFEAAIVAGREIFSDAPFAVTGFSHHREMPLGEVETIQTVVSSLGADGASVEIYSATESAAGAGQDWVSHARGKLEVLSDARQSSVTADERETWEARCKDKWRGNQLYELLSDSGLNFDSEHHVVESLQRREGEAVGQIRVPPNAADATGTTAPPPGLIEACSQLTQVALPGMPTLRAGLPLSCMRSMERLWLAGKLPDLLYAHAVTRDSDPAVGDLDLYAPDGELVGRLQGIVHGRIDASLFAAASAHRQDRWLYSIDWQKENGVEVVPGEAGNRHWLLFADRSGHMASVARKLTADGHSVTLISPGDSLQATENGWQVDPLRADEMREMLDRVQANLDGESLSILYGWSLDVADLSADEPDPTAIVADACERFLNVARAALEMNQPMTASLTLVTSGAQPVAVESGGIHLPQTAFVGLQRVLGSEHAELGSRIIDLDPAADADDNADRLVREVTAVEGSGDQQVVFRGPNRYVPRLVRSMPDPGAEDTSDLDFGDGAYLVTGGLGGIGLTVADWLVRQGARHLFLMGRSGASASVKQRIAELESLGAEVTVVQADIATVQDLRAAIDEIDGAGVTLRGVFHAAGILDDALLLHQDKNRLEKVLRPKVNGTWNLHTLTADRELDLFVMFSAAAALFGNPGQSNYAAANLFLDGMAHHRRALGLPALSINWGAWADVGMAAALGSQAHDRWAQLGVGQIEPQDGAAAMGRAMLQDVPQIAIMPINWHQWRRAFPGSRPPPFTSELLQATGDEASSGPSVASLLARLSSEDPERGIYVGEYVTRQLAGLLGLVADSIDTEQPVSDLGFDSLMATTLKTQILTDLGIDIPVSAILDGPSATEIADRLLAIFDSVRAGAGPTSARAGTAATEAGAEWEEGAL